MINKFVVAFVCLLSIEEIHAQDTTQQIVAGRSNSKLQQEKPYVILISADGFRYDFAKKYQAENLLRLSNEGVAASSMIAAFPTLTFPNHYTIVTGLYPAHHGLVGNSFYDKNKKLSYGMNNRNAVRDSSWYGGTPLWVLAEKHNMLSASFYWVGSEAAMHGLRPTYYYYYNEKIGIDDRIQTVKDWLQLPAEKRPHMITFYLPEVDHAAHRYGPESKETGEAVQFVDKAIGKMVASINSLQLPVNFIFVSDHGMTTVDTVQGIPFPAAIDSSKFILSVSDAFLQFYAKDINDVEPTYNKLKESAKDYDVYMSNQMPKRWHYSKAHDTYNRIGDIILIPHLPKVFNIGGRRITPGKHGFDPARQDMHATFFAWGPAFKQNKKIGDFENVHVYPLVAKLLGLDHIEKIDGKLKVLKKILK